MMFGRGNTMFICYGEPIWQPAGGKIDGALQFDGIDDYVETDFILNPADESLSVFAWIKGGAPGQTIISQISAPSTVLKLTHDYGGSCEFENQFYNRVVWCRLNRLAVVSFAKCKLVKVNKEQ